MRHRSFPQGLHAMAWAMFRVDWQILPNDFTSGHDNGRFQMARWQGCPRRRRRPPPTKATSIRRRACASSPRGRSSSDNLTKVHEMLERILRVGAVGRARTRSSECFYVNFESIESEYESFIEVTFNPEYVVLDGDEPTDVYLMWGTRADVIEELRQLIDGLEIALCPRNLEIYARSALFGPQRRESPLGDGDISWERFRALRS